MRSFSDKREAICRKEIVLKAINTQWSTIQGPGQKSHRYSQHSIIEQCLFYNWIGPLHENVSLFFFNYSNEYFLTLETIIPSLRWIANYSWGFSNLDHSVSKGESSQTEPANRYAPAQHLGQCGLLEDLVSHSDAKLRKVNQVFPIFFFFWIFKKFSPEIKAAILWC